ncbi:MAG: hypothetical protein H6506_04620 [Calditrichaeota bacterium]|nr:hypothetical protein [Calditrichota bacterium]MCB9366765.1 hypothetical protein [Calditrichota bacterium]MCB9391918.1 hypothetical protein [Calditrichota bacterium]
MPRIPDLKFRETLAEIAELQPADLLDQSYNPDTKFLETISLFDAICKPDFGVKWGKTTLSMDEAISRALRFEELILLILQNFDRTASDPMLRELMDGAAMRLGLLIKLADDLRYHRIRLLPDS